jgi:hypothetical protein
VIIASALERPLNEIETVCLHLSRVGQFIRRAGTLEYPDGTVTDRYEFVHAFHIEVLDGLLSAGRRVRLHQQVALTLEALSADRASELAARLAIHFVGGRDARNTCSCQPPTLWLEAPRARRSPASSRHIRCCRGSPTSTNAPGTSCRFNRCLRRR